jgi:hypothetical protein
MLCLQDIGQPFLGVGSNGKTVDPRDSPTWDFQKGDKRLDTPQVLATSATNHSPKQVVEDAIKELEYSISLPAD